MPSNKPHLLNVAQPQQGCGRMSIRPEELLLLCYYEPNGISTVRETIAFIQSRSAFSITVLNLYEHRQDNGFLKLSSSLCLDRYAGIIIHNTISYNVDNLRSLDSNLSIKFKDYRGVKVLMKQDENYRFREVAEYIGETEFDLILTCLPPEAIPKVYPRDVVGNPYFLRMLTGYVTPTLRLNRLNVDCRRVDIGYRGSLQPLSFGRLAYEKRSIGEDIKTLLKDRNFKLDISSRWEDRFGGETWFYFLRSCKVTLGVESGASIFDLEGDLEAHCAIAEERLGSFKEDREYAASYLEILEHLENNVQYHQISPRHFEAIACGTVQLLFPGNYSGLLEPNRHYFALARDYSNLEEALLLIHDEKRRYKMATDAFNEVILNPKNWIETFISQLDHLITLALQKKCDIMKPCIETSSAKNVLLIAAHDPKIDPRLVWIEKASISEKLSIHQLGVLPPGTIEPTMNRTINGNVILAYPRQSWCADIFDQLFSRVGQSPSGMAGVQELLFLDHVLKLSDEKFCEIFGAPMGAKRNLQFRWYLRYLLDTAATLINQALNLRGVHAIIATDLDTLPAALVLKGLFKVPLFYDAHEYWPEADTNSYEYEKQFWVELERRMVSHTDYRQTVSPGLATIMTEQYHAPFETLPNCEILDSLLPLRQRAKRSDSTCHFLFQGNFAIHRGIDLLIRTWPDTDPRAILFLRGHNNPYKEKMISLARQVGLMGTRIFFPEPVDESELVVKSAEADVGLIPYTSAGSNYRHCCPNKMSQYMAAALPILANETIFVSTIVNVAACGLIVDFSCRHQLVNAVLAFIQDSELRFRMGNSGREYFKKSFNWNVVSKPFYASLARAVSERGSEPFCQYLENDSLSTKVVKQDGKVIYQNLYSESLYNPKNGKTSYIVLREIWKLLPYGLRNILMPIAKRVKR